MLPLAFLLFVEFGVLLAGIRRVVVTSFSGTALGSERSVTFTTSVGRTSSLQPIAACSPACARAFPASWLAGSDLDVHQHHVAVPEAIN